MTNDAFIYVFMRLDSAVIAIVKFQLPVGDEGDQLAIRLRSMRSSIDLYAL